MFLLLCSLTAFLCFRCLGIGAIDSWDEARHGISAYEMMRWETGWSTLSAAKPITGM